jgi:hypothetical protein
VPLTRLSWISTLLQQTYRHLTPFRFLLMTTSMFDVLRLLGRLTSLILALRLSGWVIRLASRLHPLSPHMQERVLVSLGISHSLGDTQVKGTLQKQCRGWSAHSTEH